VASEDAALADVAEATSQSHAGALPRLVRTALEASGTSWAEVDGIGVSIGPGSFTGLRIGLSLVKGIAYAGRLPVVPVSTLEALAAAAEAPPGAVVWAILDARMREVYAARFVTTETGLRRETPDAALSPDACAARIEPGAWIVGDAVAAYPVLADRGGHVLPFATHHPRGSIVARLALEPLRAGRVPPLGPLEPVYVRPSQAELARYPSR
jgi:tRNA threonylcarbamoyladenosine biosynthesis protein TsaB